MKYLFLSLLVSFSVLARSQSIGYNDPCTLKNMRVKTEARFKVRYTGDTVLQLVNRYNVEGLHTSSKAFFFSGNAGESDTLIYDGDQVLTKRIVYTSSGKTRYYQYYQYDSLHNNIGIEITDAKGKLLYFDTSFYNRQNKVTNTFQRTSNKRYPKIKRFFYNGNRLLEKEINIFDGKDSSVTSYFYNKTLSDVSVKGAGRELANKCRHIPQPEKTITIYSEIKYGAKEIKAEFIYSSNGLCLLETVTGGTPPIHYYPTILSYTFYD